MTDSPPDPPIRKFSGLIRVVVSRYNGEFYLGKKAKEPVFSMGNAQISLNIVDLLRKLGHVVDVEEILDDDDV